MKTFEYTLSDPVKFHRQGQTEESTLLVFQAPSAKNRKKVAKLKQGMMRAIDGIQGESVQNVDGKPEDINPREVLALLQMSSVIEYDEYLETFVGLMTSGVCRVDGSEIMLNEKMLEDVTCEDLDNILGEYLVNFILGSLGE